MLVSIRFFDDREVRAVWDEQNAKWWFSVLDIVSVLNDQDDYLKTRNYWKYLKARLKKENSELVSTTFGAEDAGFMPCPELLAPGYSYMTPSGVASSGSAQHVMLILCKHNIASV